MNHSHLAFQNVFFTYESGLIPIIQDFTLQFRSGWSGVVGANGAGKSTLLKLAAGVLAPTEGHVIRKGMAIYCRQRMDTMPGRFREFADAPDADAWRIKSALGIEPDWTDRWETLSFGERKRVQIGTALWLQPDVFAVDEPTNHLDFEAARMVGNALQMFQGVGLLVSHDRELLDRLCTQCLFMQAGEIIVRSGNYTDGAAQVARERAHDRDRLERLDQEQKKLKRLAAKHREEASRAHKKRSKRGIPMKDHDAKFKKNIARVTGKDGTDGKLLNQMQGRIRQTRERIAEIKVTKTYDSGIWIEGCRSGRNVLFAVPGGSIPLGKNRSLEFPELRMKPADRIALTGPNGGGKSTLVRHILDHLNVDPERLIYMAQEISIPESKRVMEQIRALSNAEKGLMMSVVSRLGSRPERVLSSDLPSPGEVRKCLLALGIARRPHLIIMDEPTNHLDLPSIECLEAALSDCPCGLLLISHDHRFLARLTQTEWRISGTALTVRYQSMDPTT